MACMLIAMSLAMVTLGGPHPAIVLQLVLAIICAVVSLRVRDY